MRRLRLIVERLLTKYHITDAPVPVEDLAKALGIDVQYTSGDDDVSGALIRSKGRIVIAVNDAHHLNRQRFTIAHELGHFCLHKVAELHVDGDFSVQWRNAKASEGVNWDEIEANRFAAELLMPAQFIESKLNELSEFDSTAVPWLAARFQVSQRAMEIRLATLGIGSEQMIEG